MIRRRTRSPAPQKELGVEQQVDAPTEKSVTMSQMTLCTALRRVMTKMAEIRDIAERMKNAICARIRESFRDRLSRSQLRPPEKASKELPAQQHRRGRLRRVRPSQ